MKTAVRAFDIRGRVGRDFDAGDARRLGGAYASLAAGQGRSRVAIARDGRLTSPALQAALVEGLVDGGMQVTRLGVGPTPMLAFGVRHLGLDGGIMVTASHNPPGDNGFKLLLGGERLHGAALQALVARPAAREAGGSVEDRSVLDAYVADLAAGAGDVRPFRAAWDCGNGAAGEAVRRLTERLPGEHLLLHTAVDGRFPNHHPDPAVGANLADLQAAVLGHGCDLGFAFDGDGDRLGAVDGAGAVVWADQLLLLLAADLLRDRPGATVAGDIKCSRVLFDGVRALGGRAVIAASGYVPMKQVMQQEGAALAGELSGHVFYAERLDSADDALFAAVRVLRALSRSPRSLADFRASLPPTVITPEFRIACPDERKAAVVDEVGARLAGAGLEINHSDGLRVTTADGWWLLRASNTEAMITCRAEAADETGLERLMQGLRAELRRSGIEL